MQTIIQPIIQPQYSQVQLKCAITHVTMIITYATRHSIMLVISMIPFIVCKHHVAINEFLPCIMC